MNKRSAIGLTTAALMACASGASAAMLTQVSSFGPAATTFSTSLDFAGFNPSLGTLTEVTVTLTEAVSGTVGVTNINSSSATYQLNLINQASATFPTPIGLLALVDTSDTFSTGSLPGGGSATSPGPVTGSTAKSGSATTGLSAFEVAFVVPVTDAGGIAVSGSNAGNGSFSDNGTVTGKIVYDFTPAGSSPVPEPASLALFGTGMLGVGFARKLKRRRQKSGQPG
jgi:hypothetical protein